MSKLHTLLYCDNYGAVQYEKVCNQSLIIIVDLMTILDYFRRFCEKEKTKRKNGYFKVFIIHRDSMPCVEYLYVPPQKRKKVLN